MKADPITRNTNTPTNFPFEKFEREDIASENWLLATYAYAAFFGAREMEITPCIERNEEERRAIYNKYLEEITGYLYFDTGDVHTYEIRKCNLRGIYGGLDRKGTKVDEMPIFKFIDERIEAGIGNWKHRGERRK